MLAAVAADAEGAQRRHTAVVAEASPREGGVAAAEMAAAAGADPEDTPGAAEAEAGVVEARAEPEASAGAAAVPGAAL